MAGQKEDRKQKDHRRQKDNTRDSKTTEMERPQRQKDHKDRETIERPQDNVIEETGRHVIKRRN